MNLTHVHVSAIDFLVTLLYLVLGLFVLRLVAVTWPDSRLGQAFAFLVA